MRSVHENVQRSTIAKKFNSPKFISFLETNYITPTPETKDYTTQFLEVLKLQAHAMTMVANRFQSAPESIEKVVQLLSTKSGKIVATGSGKSGIIARKMAATVVSTGITAVYLEPNAALHGDLGIVAPGDVVVLFSNSGETNELLALLPSFEARQIPIIAIVGNLNSAIAKKAEVVLDASVEREADPWNILPTTSTTVALAIADAVVITLIQALGLSREDFLLNHPGGNIGKLFSRSY